MLKSLRFNVTFDLTKLVIAANLFFLLSCGRPFFDLVAKDPSSRFICSEIESVLSSDEMKVHLFAKDEFDVKEESFYTYCHDYLLRDDIVGNPKRWDEKESSWKLSKGSALLVSAYDQTVNHMPFVKRVHYKTVGACELGMRIYVSDLNDLKSNKLKSFLFLHGGGWKYRTGTATVAVDVTVPNITEKGYVVFSPVHRLLSDVSGPKECQGAGGQDIIDDIEDAFRWVRHHQSDYGVDENKVVVGGQSSGAYLAAFLLTHYPNDVDKGLLLYPVTDLEFVLNQLSKGGMFYNKFTDTLSSLYAFVGLNTLGNNYDQLDRDLIENSSFSKLIREQPSEFPPVFMLHGMKDDISPVELSSRLCDAFDEKGVISDERFEFMKTLQSCGENGSLFASIQGARHMMDLKCLTPLVKDLFPSLFFNEILCTVGDEQSEKKLIEMLSIAYNQFL